MATMLQILLGEAIGHRIDLSRFWVEKLRRSWKYRQLKIYLRPYREVVEQLHIDGFAMIKQAIDQDLLLGIKDQLEDQIHSGNHLIRPSKDSARRPGDLGASTVFLTDEELSKGQEVYRHQTNHVSIEDPFLHCPPTLPVAFHDLLIDIAAGYLDCLPAIGGGNLRKSFANHLPDFDTNYFHMDKNSPRFLKFFFYLNDVDHHGGPFCYVKGSHRRKLRGWRKKYRWAHSEIVAIYGEENIVELTGASGDLLIADTTGFHRGTKVRSQDRSMLTVNYLVHQEYGGRTPPSHLLRADHEQFSPRQKAAADFLEVVEMPKTDPVTAPCFQ